MKAIVKKPNHVGELKAGSFGPIRCMAEAEGYVMVRHGRCAPWVESVGAWRDRPNHKDKRLMNDFPPIRSKRPALRNEAKLAGSATNSAEVGG